jgi:hypothetical protein
MACEYTKFYAGLKYPWFTLPGKAALINTAGRLIARDEVKLDFSHFDNSERVFF